MSHVHTRLDQSKLLDSLNLQFERGNRRTFKITLYVVNVEPFPTICPHFFNDEKTNQVESGTVYMVWKYSKSDVNVDIIRNGSHINTISPGLRRSWTEKYI